MAELAARYTGRETVVADGDLLVDKFIGKVIRTLGHGTNKDANALLGSHALDPVPHAHERSIETKCHLAAVGRQVVGDGVLNNSQKLLLRSRGANRQTVQQLHHETGKALEGSGNTDGGRNLDQNSLGCVNVDLQLTSLVDGRVEQRKQALG